MQTFKQLNVLGGGGGRKHINILSISFELNVDGVLVDGTLKRKFMYMLNTENGGFKPDKSRGAEVLFPQTALVLVGRRIWLNKRTLNALMRTSMRILSLNVPQVKQQMFLYKFAVCMSACD